MSRVRIVHSDERHVSVMLLGNAVEEIARSEIAPMENDPKSMMPERLLNGLTNDQINHLVSYLESQR